MKTSIGISETLKCRLSAFKKTYNLKTYEDTLNVMLNYFAEVGDDPTKPKFVVQFQILEELKKLSKHILEVVPLGKGATKVD